MKAKRTRGAERLRKAPLVLVEWTDSYGPARDTIWHALDDYDEPEHPAIARSVGWVFKEDRESVTLVAHHHGSTYQNRRKSDGEAGVGDRASGILTIPKAAIVRRVRLTDPG